MDDEELQLLRRYWHLWDAELDRLGLSREDQAWIHAGTDLRLTEELAEAWLAELRSLPTAMGPVAYCAHLGFDYAQAKRSAFDYTQE